MGGSVEFIFPDCGKIEKALRQLCEENGIETFLFVIPDKQHKPRHIIRFYAAPHERYKDKMVITIKIEKKK